MNLFVAGWSLTDEARARALAAVRSMTEAFPLLDETTLGYASVGRAFVAWLHWPVTALGARRYVHRGADAFTVFDGVAADPAQRIAAHDAASLSEHWYDLTQCLEGHYLAVRLERAHEALEIVNDPFGLHPAFVHKNADSWWVANSVSLLTRAVGAGTLDRAALANYLVLHQPGGDRTLVEGITELPPGQRWRWHGDGEPKQTTYAPMSDLARVPRRSFGAEEARELVGSIGATLRSLSAEFAPLQCPITSGRDSRMLVAAMMAEKQPGDFFTAGDHEGADARHGAEIARRFGLPHLHKNAVLDGLLAQWDTVSRRSVLQTDGLVTLAHASNAFSAPDRLERVGVQLYGAGGELARLTELRLRFMWGRPGVADAVREVLRVVDQGGVLVRRSARERAREHVARRMRLLWDVGFRPVDLPLAYEAFENNRRWSAAQARQIAGHKGVHMPLWCRAYVRAAFETPPTERLMERVPYAFVGNVSPELRDMPTAVPWPPQWGGGLAVARVFAHGHSGATRLQRRVRRRAQPAAGKPREKRLLLGALVPRWRERFLDQADSCVWDLLERGVFEALTAQEASPRKRAANGPALFQAVTVFTYEEVLRAWVGWRPAANWNHGAPLSGAADVTRGAAWPA